MSYSRCANPACNRTYVIARGRCQACYVFYKKHGRDPRREEMVLARRWKRRRLCRNCGRRPVRTRGRCSACYNYLLRTGRERPARLYQPRPRRDPNLCSICQQRPVYRRGHCRSCHARARLRAWHNHLQKQAVARPAAPPHDAGLRGRP
jgi:hypothetical protein